MVLGYNFLGMGIGIMVSMWMINLWGRVSMYGRRVAHIWVILKMVVGMGMVDGYPMKMHLKSIKVFILGIANKEVDVLCGRMDVYMMVISIMMSSTILYYLDMG